MRLVLLIVLSWLKPRTRSCVWILIRNTNSYYYYVYTVHYVIACRVVPLCCVVFRTWRCGMVSWSDATCLVHKPLPQTGKQHCSSLCLLNACHAVSEKSCHVSFQWSYLNRHCRLLDRKSIILSNVLGMKTTGIPPVTLLSTVCSFFLTRTHQQAKKFTGRNNCSLLHKDGTFYLGDH